MIYLTAGGSIHIKDLDASVVEMYIQDMRAKCEESFLIFKYLYRTQKVVFSSQSMFQLISHKLIDL